MIQFKWFVVTVFCIKLGFISSDLYILNTNVLIVYNCMLILNSDVLIDFNIMMILLMILQVCNLKLNIIYWNTLTLGSKLFTRIKACKYYCEEE